MTFSNFEWYRYKRNLLWATICGWHSGRTNLVVYAAPEVKELKPSHTVDCFLLFSSELHRLRSHPQARVAISDFSETLRRWCNTVLSCGMVAPVRAFVNFSTPVRGLSPHSTSTSFW